MLLLLKTLKTRDLSFVDHVVATTGHACPHTAEIHVVPVFDILPLMLLEIRAQILMLVAAAAGSKSAASDSSPLDSQM